VRCRGRPTVGLKKGRWDAEERVGRTGRVKGRDLPHFLQNRSPSLIALVEYKSTGFITANLACRSVANLQQIRFNVGGLVLVLQYAVNY